MDISTAEDIGAQYTKGFLLLEEGVEELEEATMKTKERLRLFKENLDKIEKKLNELFDSEGA